MSTITSGAWPSLSTSWRARPSGLPPSMMSTPRPAMFVATVTALSRPAWATICASRVCCLALSTSWGMPRWLQLAGQVLALLDADRADEHRLAGLVALGDVLDDGVELGDLALVDEVGLVDAADRLVGRDRHDAELVGVHQLGGLGGGRAGHPGELVVHAEVVLQRDRREGLVLLLDLHAFLGLHRLVDALAPAPTLEDAAGELVDDLHLAVLDDVVLVPLVELLGLQRDRAAGGRGSAAPRRRGSRRRAPPRPCRCRPRAGRRRACPPRPRSRRRAAASGRSRRSGSRAWRRRRRGRR